MGEWPESPACRAKTYSPRPPDIPPFYRRCTLIAIHADLEALLGDAQRAVDSFYPGHWNLMVRLEERAKALLVSGNIAEAIDFLADVTVLKQPYRVDRQKVCERLRAVPNEIESAIDALGRISSLDYRAMDVLSKVPWFGIGGGRAFNSAVMRLVRPESFGIIDWRNLAVLMGAPGFDGLVEPAVHFSEVSSEEVLKLKGHLILTQEIYEKYNDSLRVLAGRHAKKAAEIDLCLWIYSIRKQPFRSPDALVAETALVVNDSDRRVLRTGDRSMVVSRIVQKYLATLKDGGPQTRKRVTRLLQAIFELIRDECELFGQHKRGRPGDRIKLSVMALNDAIAKQNEYGLLALWSRWQSKVDTASSGWIGIDLPTDMVFEGYLVFEDFLPVKNYFEEYYDSESLEPKVDAGLSG